MEILFAFVAFYLVWRLARGVIGEIVGSLQLALWLLTAPVLWLGRRQVLAAQRRGTMQELRSLALPPGGGLR
jgi:hypothetical protein